MKYLPTILPAALLLALSPYASAGFVKCVDADGKTTYTDGFCPESAPSAKKPDSLKSVKTGGAAMISAGLGVVYGKQLSALQANSWTDYLDTLAASRRTAVEAAGAKHLEMLKAMAPTGVQVVEETVAPNGSSGMLKVKGVIPMSGSDEVQYGTVEFVKQAGSWKIDRQAWSQKEWVTAKEASAAAANMQNEGCAELKGKPESLPAQEMMKVSFRETQVAKFELPPGSTKDVSFPAAKAQKVSFRVAFNNALKCKYKGDYPTGMSADGGKTWLYSYHAGQSVKPLGGQIRLAFRNKGQEPMNFVVVTE